MTYARQSPVCLQAKRYDHVVSRCVRRAWLYGFDEYAGRDYSHRKQWVLERLRGLSAVFAIDLCADALMSNHSRFRLIDRAGHPVHAARLPDPRRLERSGCAQR